MYFDTVDKARRRGFLDKRVCAGEFCRTLGKQMKAGMIEARSYHRPEHGIPQGDVVFMFRFADDAVLVFKYEADAQQVLEVLAKRFGRFGLTLVQVAEPPFPCGANELGSISATEPMLPPPSRALGTQHLRNVT